MYLKMKQKYDPKLDQNIAATTNNQKELVMTSNNFSALSLKGYQLCQKNFFFYSILANLHTTTYKNKTKR